jgi:predicted phosphodiesterase
MKKGELTVEEIQRQSVPKETKKQIEALQTALSRLQETRHYVCPVKTKGNTLRFGVISDTHAGSLFERFDALEEFFGLLRHEKITDVYHAGDVLDGNKIYRGQEYEQHAHGVRRQIRTLVEKHPDTKGMNYRFITGNHDYSFDRQVDIGIGDEIAKQTGWTYVGRDVGWVEMVTEDGHRFNVGLYHPDGGTAYAISYKSQKLIEQIPGGRKPDMVFIGHYHKAEWLPRYRNVNVFQAGCFQSQTSYMARKPTDAHVGGWVIEVVLGDRKHLTNRVKAEFISFYEPEETNYE